MSRLTEINDRQTAIRSALLELEGHGELADDEQQSQDDLLTEFEALDEERTPLQTEHDEAKAQRAQRMEKLIATASEPHNNEPTYAERTGGFGSFTRNTRDPFAELGKMGEGMVKRSDMRARAYTAIERSSKTDEFGWQLSHDKAEEVTRKLQTDAPRFNDVSRHILATGSPEYQELFQKYLENPTAYRGMMDSSEVSRAALTLSTGSGGYLLPYVLDPSIILTNNSSANPFRRISNMKTTTSNAWQGVSSAGVTAAWLAEGTVTTDTTPTVGQIQITPQKGSAWVFGSYEVLADTDFAQQLPGLLADARDRLEEAAFVAGNGTTTGPYGITISATTTVNTATTLVYAIADVYATQAALPPRFRTSSSAAWLMNIVYLNKTRQFDTAGGASFWTNLGKGQPETLLGAPIYESTSMFSSTQASGSLLAVFGDFQQYIIVDRIGVSIIYEPLVKGTGGILPGGQAGWFMFWRVGANVSTASGFRVLKGL